MTTPADGRNYGSHGYYYDTDDVHRERWKQSVSWAVDAMRSVGWPTSRPECRMLEVGGEGPWTQLIREQYGVRGLRIDRTPMNIDLRTDAYWPESGVFDVVVSMEVIEHLHEAPGRWGNDPWPDPVAGTGAQFSIEECFRVLKPGGVLFLTTPNGASYRILWEVVHGKPGMMFRPHFREYSVPELIGLVARAGFGIKRVETSNVWRNGNAPKEKMEALQAMVNSLGGSQDHRGEDTFLLAVKPERA